MNPASMLGHVAIHTTGILHILGCNSVQANVEIPFIMKVSLELNICPMHLKIHNCFIILIALSNMNVK